MNITEIRQQYPQYADVSDADLAKGLHAKFYSDMPFDQFASKIGLAPKSQEQRYSEALKDQQAQQISEMGTGDKILAGIGKAPVDLYRGLKQIISNTAASQASAQRDVDESRKLDAPLLGTGAGMTGNIAGNVATLIPAAFVPGANSVAGASAVGAIGGALTPTAEGESRAKNIALGAGIGAASQYGLGKVADKAGTYLANREASEAVRQASNAGRDATLQASREAGYVIPPSMTESGFAGRALEGLSGSAKTAQVASVKNQNVTQRLANKALGLAEDAPLNTDATKAVRAAAYEKGYAPIDALPEMPTDATFAKALDSIGATRQGAARSFPEMVGGKLDFLDNLRVGSFHPQDARQASQILRDEAGAAFAQGDKELGKAKLQAATALEDQIERGLEALGKDGADQLKNFREARTLIAKTFDVDKALASGKGKVNAEVFAAALRKGKPLSGDLKTIGEFANSFGDAARIPKKGWSAPFSVLDYAAGSFGSPALPLARVGSRAAILSGPGQRMLGAPQYGPSVAEKLTPEMLRLLQQSGAGGLLGAGYAQQ